MIEPKTVHNHKKKNSSLIINGIHLHSKVDPHKEAEIFCEKYESEIFGNKKHFVLGLGLGYHLNELIKKLYKLENKINISILEPNAEIIENYKAEFPQFSEIPGLNFFTGNPNNLFLDNDFISILCHKPAILIHKSSYDANKEYFYNFLTYKSNSNIASYKNLISHDFSILSPIFQSSQTWKKEDIDNIIKKNQYNFETVFWLIYNRI